MHLGTAAVPELLGSGVVGTGARGWAEERRCRGAGREEGNSAC